jgi:hypothetical protein
MLDEEPIETTLYSLAAAAPAAPERRSSERYLSLLRVGTLLIGERRELCLIKNVSVGGMLIRAYSPLEPGTGVAIELKQGEPVEATVLWVKGELVGVEFATPIDIVALISGSADGLRPRMPRIEVGCTAWVRQGATTYRTRILNVSQGGVCVQSTQALSVGQEVVVTLPGLAPEQAVVRWADGDGCGITFNRVIALAQLVGWLTARQEQEQRRAAV